MAGHTPTLPQALNRAVSAYQAEKFIEAEKICRQIISAKHDFFDALHLLAIVQASLGKNDLALASYDRALAVRPDHADALYNRGVTLRNLKRHDEALASYDRALSLRPDDADALYNRGVTLHKLKRLDEALASYDRALLVRPDHAEALNNRGVTLQELKRYEEALASYDRALSLRPDDADALYNRGVTLQELKRLDEALASYDRALAVRPDYAEALYNRGNALQELQRLDEALASYDRALSVRPDHAQALNNRGNALKALMRLDEALASYDRALSLRPDYAEALNNRGIALKELKRYEEALASYDRALSLRPDFADALYNRGNILLVELLRLGHQREADLLYRQQTRQHAFITHANYNKSLRVLRLIATDLASTYLDTDSNQAKMRVEGHWESDHFLIDQEFGTITGYLFSDTDPRRVVDFIRKSDRKIIVNCIADPDLFSKTLDVADQVVRMARLPIINPPQLIMQHTRDANARRLQGISQLVVPQTIRLAAQPDSPKPFPFPFIARECGTQTGETMELIEDDAEFDSFLRRHDTRQIYLTQFIDFRSSDGVYRKYRARVVGDEIVPNHLFVDIQWNVHGHAAREFMANKPVYLAEEREYLSKPLVHLDILREIHKRIGVDFYGIDYSVLPSGALVLFEANAAMRSIWPEWRERFPETWGVTQQTVHRFIQHLRAVARFV